MTTEVKQGHRYRWHDRDVLAMTDESDNWVRVRELPKPGAADPWLGRRRYVPAAELTPQPMRYHGGEVPA